ncbi:MAG: ribosome recycling factor [Armatimonadota bacterium]
MDRVIADANQRMSKAVEATERELAAIRTGRASPALLDKVQVDAYDSKMPVNQLATIAVPEPRLITITPWDKNITKNIENALLQSELGLTPSSDGNVIRLQVPPLTEERRQEMVKLVRKVGEDGRVAVRNVRRDAIDKIKRMEQEEHLSEDEVHLGQSEIQEATDKYIEQLDELVEKKAAEVMEV